jgi:hypothetical protein
LAQVLILNNFKSRNFVNADFKGVAKAFCANAESKSLTGTTLAQAPLMENECHCIRKVPVWESGGTGRLNFFARTDKAATLLRRWHESGVRVLGTRRMRLKRAYFYFIVRVK